ncbi:hypothetical protein NIES4101_70340 [Calothrix sp. NIES-4101]|nr:hypothetical protein NIES4101_70340 [Calothrix sp. NIES-4101]
MQPLDFCIVTPSYAPDFERCRLLAWSLEAFAPASVKHYIIVPQRDLSLFRQIKQRNTEIITVESILPAWIQRLPLLKGWWLSFKHVLVRGWIIQQIIKLSTAEFLREDIFIFADSDVAFIRPFDLNNFVSNSKVRLFRVPAHIATQQRIGEKWHQTAHHLLGLPEINPPLPGYIGQIISWQRDNLLKLYNHIETVARRGWIETVCRHWHLSEYILYGIFVEHILQENCGHYYDSKPICHEYWLTEEMSDEALQDFFASHIPEEIAVMISAKAKIGVQKYENLVKKFHSNFQ